MKGRPAVSERRGSGLGAVAQLFRISDRATSYEKEGRTWKFKKKGREKRGFVKKKSWS